MNKEEINTILSLINLVTVHSIPVIKKAIENLGKETITEEDIKNLKIDRGWDNYFRE